jgi:tetratricopeptide (TPR) repeat protein
MVFDVAWQCRQLGDQPLADDLFSEAFAGLPDEDKLRTILAGVEYLWQTGQVPRAEALLQPLLKDSTLAQRPSLWRLAALLAGQRQPGLPAVPYLEQALELEYSELPELINLQAVRSDYGTLLAHYQTLAGAMATLHVAPQADFVAKVIRAADRWRSLDSDGTAACQAAARVLKLLGDGEQAWDYLTTPIGLHPNEAAPWSSMAQTLRTEGSFLLADRAYAQAFEAEPTNAQILWDRALNLHQAGMTLEAQKLFRQIADGQWQPRFGWIQTQARQQLQGR